MRKHERSASDSKTAYKLRLYVNKKILHEFKKFKISSNKYLLKCEEENYVFTTYW